MTTPGTMVSDRPAGPAGSDPPPATGGAAPKRTAVLIVDDHPIVRQGLALLINQEPDLAVCAEAESMEDAMRVVESFPPDVAVVDIALKGANGIELIKRLRARFTALPVVVLSMHEETLYAERALRAGANGYVMKHEAATDVVGAIRDVLQGELHVSEKMMSRLLRNLVSQTESAGSPVEQLSDRELEVFQLIGQGRGTRDIAKRLHLSVKTVETHRAHIKQKLHLRHANELVHYASNWVQSQSGG